MNGVARESPLGRWTASATATVLLWISRTLAGLLVAFPILQAIKVSGMVSGVPSIRRIVGIIGALSPLTMAAKSCGVRSFGL